MLRNLTTFAFITFVLAGQAMAKDQIRIVGSSTVYPFTTAVAEQFGKKTGNATPIVESTGTGGGIKLFCEGVGNKTPDIVNASRAMKKSEIAMCEEAGVQDIIEMNIGYDGIVLARSKESKGFNVSLKDLFLALADKIPQNGKLVNNPYKKWSDVNKNLPDEEIVVLGPPTTSGTRDAFVELVMEKGCALVDGAEKLGLKEKACHSIREDGAWRNMGEADNVIVKKIEADHNAVGVFGYAYFEENRNMLRALSVDNKQPTYDSIADNSYEISRPLYIYIKGEHLKKVSGLSEFVKEFLSDDAVGEFGYLTERGLIPLDTKEYEGIRKKLRSIKPLAFAVN